MKTFFTRYGIQVRLGTSVLVMLLCILLPYGIVTNTTSNGLGAGLYVLSIACFIPAASLINGILAAADLRRLWFLPAVPAILSLLLYPVSRDMYLTFQLTPVLALAVGYAAMVLCVFLLKQKKNKKL